jgi:hypothetical protein
LGAAGAGFVLAGCGSAADSGPLSDQLFADAAMLDSLLQQEYTLLAAYDHAIGRLSGSDRALAVAIRAQERNHADALAAQIRSRKVTPSSPAATYSLPALSGAAGALALLDRIEQQTIALYVDSLAKIGSVEVRVFAAQMMANEAQHASLLAAARRLPPLPTALVTGAP